LLSSIGFAAAYPFLHSLTLLIGLGGIEAIGVAIAYPAAQSLLAQAVPEGSLGRAQGLFNATQTAAMAVAAAASGALFGVAAWIPFVGAAASSAALAGALPFVWRSHPSRPAPGPAEPAISVIV
jgi:DHA1 family multidrug resistance protein-like MFS transporter